MILARLRIDLTIFTKTMSRQSIGHTQSLRRYARLNTLAIVTDISEYSFGITIEISSKEMTLYGIILYESQLGIDDGSGYTAREKDIGFVPKPI